MRRLGIALVEVLRAATDRYERAARDEHIHPTDFSCIGYLSRVGKPVSPKDIIAYLGLSSGSGTALLDRLEKAGYIRRLPNPEDRRGVLIALDPEAAAAPIAQYRTVTQQFFDATDPLTDRDLDTIATFLERVSRLAREAGST